VREDAVDDALGAKFSTEGNVTSDGLNRMSVCERVLPIVTSSLTANFHVRSVVSRPHVITHAESAVCSIATALQ